MLFHILRNYLHQCRAGLSLAVLLLLGFSHFFGVRTVSAAPNQQNTLDTVTIVNLINADCLINRADVSSDSQDTALSNDSQSHCLSLEDPDTPVDLESYCIEQHQKIVNDPTSAVTIVNWSQFSADDATIDDLEQGSLWCIIEYPESGGTLAGDLWLDSDGNGLQDAGESAMGGITISLYDADEELLASATTDANGQYFFVSDTDPRLRTIYNPPPAHVGVVPSTGPLGGLPPNTRFQIQADMNQAAIGGRGLTEVNVDNGQPNADEVDSDAFRVDDRAVINVQTGELGRDDTTNDMGFGPFTAVIDGEVWNDLENTGIQNPDIPLANGVIVNLLNTNAQLVATTITQNDGQYTFDKLPAESYEIEFRPASATVWFSLKDQGTDEALDSDVNVTTGRTDVITMANGETVRFTDAGLVRGIPGNYQPQLANPGEQFNALGDDVHTIFIALDAIGDTISYQAMGLPPGLTIDNTNGHVTGTPTATGAYAVVITAYDGNGGVTDIAFNWTISETPITFCGSTEQEAEDARLLGGFAKVIAIDGASGNQHVLVPNGKGNEWNGFNTDNQASFCFNVATPGRYTILGKTNARSGTNDSFYVTVNNSPSQGFLWDVARSSDYTDSSVTHRLADDQTLDPVEVWLTAGNQQLSIGLREDGTRLDKVSLQVEEVASAPACDGLTVEAENGSLSGSFSIVDDASASNGQYIQVQEGIGINVNGINPNGVASADKVDYCFNVTQAGLYTLVTSALADDANNGSIYVTVDGEPANGYLWDLAVGTSFEDDALNSRGQDDPVLLDLDVGMHTVTVYLREDGSKLDKFSLVPTSGAMVVAAGADTAVVTDDSSQQSVDGSVELTNVSSASSPSERVIYGLVAIPSSYPWEPGLSGMSINVTGDSGYSRMVTTDVNGIYYVDDLSDDDYTVSVNLPDDQNGMNSQSQNVTVAGGTTVNAPFTYDPPQPDFGLFFPLLVR